MTVEETHFLVKDEEEKKKLLNKQELDEIDKTFSLNALKILNQRYLLRDDEGKVIETPKQLFERVAITVALGDIIHDPRIFTKDLYLEKCSGFADWDVPLFIGEYQLNEYHKQSFIKAFERMEGSFKVNLGKAMTMFSEGDFDSYEKNVKEYYDLMANQIFLPNTPTLMNAGTQIGQLSACFVLPVPDSIVGMMDMNKRAAIIFKSGGGVGFNFTPVRAEGSIVKSTGGTASGPVSFIRITDMVSETVKQGGRRRAANMGILHWNHPDIEKFITAKTKPGILENFNVSVGIDKAFWSSDKCEKLLNLIAKCAWKSAEPGLIFLDKGNENNVMRESMGDIITTNPCGEQYLYPHESCNLGSINVSKFIYDYEYENMEDGTKRIDKYFDYGGFTETVKLTTRFLDNIIDMNNYPLEEIDKATKKTRRIGLGIMGAADLLHYMEIPYNSNIGRRVIESIFESMAFYSMLESNILAVERGSFPMYDKSRYVNGDLPIKTPETIWGGLRWDKLQNLIKNDGIRNAWTTTVAPTGTIAMLADCSNAVEPTFSLLYEKRVSLGKFYYISAPFEKYLEEKGLMENKELLQKINNNMGSIQKIPEFPKKIRDSYVTAMDISWQDHILMQSVCQRWVSNSISKTINMPPEATIEDVKQAYMLAYRLDCKGITIYRDGSRETQVMHRPTADDKTKCPHCGEKLIMEAGCSKCPQCTYSGCSIS